MSESSEKRRLNVSGLRLKPNFCAADDPDVSVLRAKPLSKMGNEQVFGFRFLIERIYGSAKHPAVDQIAEAFCLKPFE